MKHVGMSRLDRVEGTSQTLPPNERHKVKDFETLRNLANGQDPNDSEIDMIIKELEEEKRENKHQPEPEN